MKFLFLFLPMLAFAAGAKAEPDYDIVARTINFAIFAGILYYLLANPIKNAYKSRIDGIEKKITQTRNKILAAHQKEQDAKDQVEVMKEKAERFIEAGKIEARHMAMKIENDTQSTIKFMSENYIEQKEFARRDSLKKTVESVLNEAFEDESIKLSGQSLVDIINKKVG